MKFSDCIKQLLQITGAYSSTIAKNCNLDPSLISRYKNGNRIPRENSEEIKKISEAFIKVDGDKLNKLFIFFGTKNIEELRIKIYDYLNTSKLNCIKRSRKESKTVLTRFSEKLNLCMKTLEISNTELSTFLSIDTSLISRYRNNLRSINSNNIIIEKICSYFVKVATEKNKLYELYSITLIQKKFNVLTIEKSLIKWFKSNEKLGKDIAIENFLIALSSYNHKNNRIDIKEQNKKYISSKEDFIGNEGLKTATITFLNKLLNFEHTTLHLYSNRDISWIYNDEEMKSEWYRSLFSLIKKGYRIILYRDIEYSVEQMIDSLSEFLPLYYSGQIEYRYITKTQNPKFTVNFLIADNIGYLYSSGVINSDEFIEHHISFDKSKTNNYMKQFSNIINLSYPLLIIKDASKLEYRKLHKGFNDSSENITNLLSSPYISTMNVSLINKILQRNNVDEVNKNKILDFYKIQFNIHKQILEKSKTTDYILLNNERASLDLNSIYNEKILYFTSDEYKEQIKHMKLLAKKNNNYNVKFIHSLPFKNIKILIKPGYGVIITKDDKNSKVSFLLQHNILTETFIKYVQLLENN